MRVLVALATITAVAGCAALTPFGPAPEDMHRNRLLSCGMDVPEDWHDALETNEMVSSRNEPVSVVGASADGRTTLVQSSRDNTGSELVLRADGQRQEIITPKDGEGVNDADFDGRWATFTILKEPREPDEIFAWDSHRDGAPARIATGHGAVVRRGKAVHSDGTNVELHDLATKKSSVIGQGDTPALFEDMVVWRQDGKLRAMKLDKTEAGLPESMRDVPVETEVVSDGRTLVWARNYTLHAWRTGWPAPRQIAEINGSDQGERITIPVVNGDFVSWHSDGPYVTDIRTGATAFSASPEFTLRVRGGVLTLVGERVSAATPLSSLSPLPAC